MNRINLKNLTTPIILVITYIILCNVIFSNNSPIPLTFSLSEPFFQRKELLVSWFVPTALSLFVSALIFTIAYDLELTSLKSNLMRYIALIAIVMVIENYLAIVIINSLFDTKPAIEQVNSESYQPTIFIIHCLLTINITAFIFSLYTKRHALALVPLQDNHFIIISYTTLSFITIFCKTMPINTPFYFAIGYALYTLYCYSWSKAELNTYSNTDNYVIKIIKATTLLGLFFWLSQLLLLITLILILKFFSFNLINKYNLEIFNNVAAFAISTILFFILSKKSSSQTYKIVHWIIYALPIIAIIFLTSISNYFVNDTPRSLYSLAIAFMLIPAVMLTISYFINKLALRLSFK